MVFELVGRVFVLSCLLNHRKKCGCESWKQLGQGRQTRPRSLACVGCLNAVIELTCAVTLSGG